MFKITTKPIIAIVGSRSINSVNFNRFINKDHIAQVVSGGANGVDKAAEQWAKQNRIDFLEFKPNYKIYGKRAPLVRDEEIVNYCDAVIAFWDQQSSGTLYTLKYATKLKRPIYLHIIEERD